MEWDDYGVFRNSLAAEKMLAFLFGESESCMHATNTAKKPIFGSVIISLTGLLYMNSSCLKRAFFSTCLSFASAECSGAFAQQEMEFHFIVLRHYI